MRLALGVRKAISLDMTKQSERMSAFLHNLKQLAIAIDQLLNVLIGLVGNRQAWADETMSAHAWRMHLERNRSWAYKLIDILFFFDKDHCRTSYESEVMKRQMPPSMRE